MTFSRSRSPWFSYTFIDILLLIIWRLPLEHMMV